MFFFSFIKLYGSYTHRTGPFFVPLRHDSLKTETLKHSYVKSTSHETWTGLRSTSIAFARLSLVKDQSRVTQITLFPSSF